MQVTRRSNQQRTDQTRGALLGAARALFIEKGFAGTSTPEIVAAAGITRGALYHHFEDKRALFRAVIVAEFIAVAAAIEASSPSGVAPLEALIEGGNAYLDAMQAKGRTRLLLVEGPAVLGAAEMAALDNAHTALTLRQGLAALNGPTSPEPIMLDALTALLSAAFDRAALAIDGGAAPGPYREAIAFMIKRIAGHSAN